MRNVILKSKFISSPEQIVKKTMHNRQQYIRKSPFEKESEFIHTGQEQSEINRKEKTLNKVSSYNLLNNIRKQQNDFNEEQRNQERNTNQYQIQNYESKSQQSTPQITIYKHILEKLRRTNEINKQYRSHYREPILKQLYKKQKQDNHSLIAGKSPQINEFRNRDKYVLGQLRLIILIILEIRIIDSYRKVIQRLRRKKLISINELTKRISYHVNINLSINRKSTKNYNINKYGLKDKSKTSNINLRQATKYLKKIQIINKQQINNDNPILVTQGECIKKKVENIQNLNQKTNNFIKTQREDNLVIGKVKKTQRRTITISST